jgi:predicted nuclease of predicted toxin-antitoxin system
MRILLDNCVKKELLSAFEGYDALHVADIGWSASTNGELLRSAAKEFDLLVTVDKNMRFQRSLKGLELRVAILDVRSNMIEELEIGAGRLLSRINELEIGQFTLVPPS